MKRIFSLIMVLMISLLIVVSPIAIDKPHALGEYDELVMTMNPGMLGWLLTQWGSMGFQAGNLSEQLDYINRNGNIDQYFANVWADFQTDVQRIQGYATDVFKVTGYLWQDLFAGDPLRNIIGVKEMYDQSTDPLSDYYVDTTLGYYYGTLNIELQNSSTSLKDRYTAISGTQQRIDWLKLYNANDFVINGKLYTVDHIGTSDYFRQKDDATNAILTELWGFSHATYTSYPNYKLAANYIYSDGHLDANGNKYKLVCLPYDYHWYPPTSTYVVSAGNQYTIIPSLSESSLSSFPKDSITFDNEGLDTTITDEDITADDYVLYEINRELIEQIQELQMKISMNEDTAEDWVLNPPEVVRVESTNTIIREVIQADSAVIPAELEFPELQELELPSALLTKFPFCIPWDVYNIFAMLNKPPVEPRFEIPFVIENIVDYEFVIEFDQFENLFVIARWFILALFCLGLIIMTRNMIKG